MAIVEQPLAVTDVRVDLTINCPPNAFAVSLASGVAGYRSRRPTEDGRVAVRFHRAGSSAGDIIRRLCDEIQARCDVAVVSVDHVA
jgi:hypothetical protein